MAFGGLRGSASWVVFLVFNPSDDLNDLFEEARGVSAIIAGVILTTPVQQQQLQGQERQQHSSQVVLILPFSPPIQSSQVEVVATSAQSPFLPKISDSVAWLVAVFVPSSLDMYLSSSGAA